MKSTLKKLARLLFWVVIGLVTLVMLFIAAIQLPFVKQLILDQAVHRINEAIDGRVAIEDLEGNLLTEIRLRNIAIYDARGRLATRIDTVEADYTLVDIINGRLVLDRAEVHRPLVIVRIYEDGTMNLATIAPPPPDEPSEPSEFQVFLDAIRLREGLILYLDEARDATKPQQQARAALAQLFDVEDFDKLRRETIAEQATRILSDAAASTEAPSAPIAAQILALDADAQAAVLGNQQVRFTLDSLEARARTDAWEVAFPLRSGTLQAFIDPEYVRLEHERFDLGFDSGWSNLEAHITFDVSIDPLGSRESEDLRQFHVAVEEMRASQELLAQVAPQADLRTGVTLSGQAAGDTEDVFVTADLPLHADEGKLALAAAIALPADAGGAPRFRAALSATNLAVHEYYPLDLDASASQVAAIISGQGADAESIVAEARVHGQEIEVEAYDIDTFYTTVRYNQGEIVIEPLGVLSPYLDLFVTGAYDPAGEFSLQLRTTADRGRAERAPPRSPFQTQQADLRLELSGQFDPSVDEMIDALTSMDVNGRWSFQAFQAEDIEIGRSRGSLAAMLNRVGPREKGRYDVVLQLDALVARLVTPELRVASLDARGQGQAVVDLPIDDPMRAIHRLRSSLQTSISGLRHGDTYVDSADIDAQLTKSPAQTRSINYSLESSLRGLVTPDANVGAIRSDLEGQLALNLEREGLKALRRLTIRGDLDADDLRAANVTAENVQTRWDISGPLPALEGQLQVQASEVDAAGEQFPVISTDLDLLGERRYSLDLTAIRPSEVGPPLRLTLGGQYPEELDGLDIDALELGTPSAMWRLREGAHIQLRPDRLFFRDAFLALDGQAISLDGNLRFPGRQQLDVQAYRFDLETLREQFLPHRLPPLEGLVDLEMNLRGTARRPQADLQLDLRHLRLEDTGPIDASLKAQYDDERLQVDEFHASAFGQKLVEMTANLPVHIDLEGRAEFQWQRSMEANIDILPFQLEDFHDPLPVLQEYQAEGKIEGQLRFSGTLDAPRLSSQVRAEDLQVVGEIGEDFIALEDATATFSLQYRPPTNGTGGMELAANVEMDGEPQLQVQSSAALPLAQWLRQTLEGTPPEIEWDDELLQTPFTFNLQMPHLDVRRIPLESFAEADATGIIRANIDAQGTLGEPNAKVQIALDRFGWSTYRDIFVHFDATLDEQIFELSRFRFDWDGDEILVARGTIPAPIGALIEGAAVEDLPADFSLQLRELPIAKLSAVDYTFAQIRGTVTGYLRATGTLREPEIHARAGLFNTELADRRNGTISLSIDGAENRVRVNASLCREYEEIMLADADVPILMDVVQLAQGASPLAPGPLDVRVVSEKMDLARVVPTRLFRNYATDLAGIFEVDLAVNGTWNEPRPDGTITLQGGAVTLPLYARRLERIQADISIDDERLRVTELSATDGPSVIQVSGFVTHERLRPQRVESELKAQQFNIGGFATDFPAFVTADVDVTGNLAATPSEVRTRISGLEVRLPDIHARDLHPTELHEEIIVVGDTTRARRRDPRDVADLTVTREAESDVLNMRLHVLVERNSWIRHPNGDVNFQADLVADVVDSRSAVTGEVQAIRGEFEFLGRRFVVGESAILFTGAVPPNPRLQIEATHPMDRAVTAALGPPTSGEPRIIFRITGTAREPRLELTSDPAMTDTEILFVLVTGRAPERSDIGQDEGVATRALSAVSGLFFGMLQDQLAGTVPVDVLRLEAGERGFRGGRVEVGKYVTNDVFVAYRYEFGAEEDQATNVIRIEYHFLPRWMFEILYTDRNEGEFNLFWDVF